MDTENKEFTGIASPAIAQLIAELVDHITKKFRLSDLPLAASRCGLDWENHVTNQGLTEASRIILQVVIQQQKLGLYLNALRGINKTFLTGDEQKLVALRAKLQEANVIVNGLK